MKVEEYINKIKKLDNSLEADIQKKLDFLTKPRGSLGRLEELAMKYALTQNSLNPVLNDKVIFTLAGDHGVTEEGVSTYPSEVTLQMVYNFINGGAAINVLARQVGAKVIICDLGVKSDLDITDGSFRNRKINNGTSNFVKGPAMSYQDAQRSLSAGIEIFEEELPSGIDVAATGDMGIGNTTASAAVISVLTGKSASEIAGRGTGLDDSGLKRKIKVIQEAIDTNKPDPSDPVDVLSKVGGYEIGGIAGVILAAAANSVPVIIDGFISGAAALLAFSLKPEVKDYIIAAHRSAESGHGIMLDYMGLDPLLELDLRLGEGTGAALAMGLLESGVRILNEMATFESAGVTDNK